VGVALRTAPRGFVLDDDRGIQKMVCRVLTQNGFDALPFSSTIALFSALKAQAPDFLVLDLALGRSDGIEVIRHLETAGYEGNVLLISGRDESDLIEARNIGLSRGLAMLPPLHKPFCSAALLDNLSAHADVRRKEPQSPISARIQIDLAEALQNHWLELWYQPKFDLNLQHICGAEALLRIRHPEHGVVTPNGFLPRPGDPLHRTGVRDRLRSGTACVSTCPKSSPRQTDDRASIQ
jgi:FixJ family two-component response regulator